MVFFYEITKALFATMCRDLKNNFNQVYFFINYFSPKMSNFIYYYFHLFITL